MRPAPRPSSSFAICTSGCGRATRRTRPDSQGVWTRHRAMAENRWMKLRAAAVLLCVLAMFAGGALARTTPEALVEVALADLPKEAQEVYALVGKGGPFAFDRDGVVFGNREKLLPGKPRGYYHEYT